MCFSGRPTYFSGIDRMANAFNTLLYTDSLAAGTDKLNANFSLLQNSPTNGYGVASVALLPALPDANYPEGSIVYLTADGKLYKNDGGVWVPVVNAVDLAGQVAAGQIEDGALDIAKFAAGIMPPRIVTSLPALPDSSYPNNSLVLYNGILYKNASGSWQNVVNATDFVGELTATNIADNAITTGKINTGAITSAKISAGAVTAAALSANSVTAGKIQAGAVGAAEIAAGAVTAKHLRVGSFDNMIVNADWLDGVSEPWTTTGTANFPLGISGSPAVRNAYIPVGGSASSNYFPVSAGETYYVQSDTYCYWSGYQVVIRFYSSGTTYLSEQIVYSGTFSGWKQVAGQVTVPATAQQAQLVYRAIGGATNYAYFCNPRVLRAGEGRLIVDGAINADKIAAGSIETDHLTAGLITATELAADAVTAGKIDASAVGTRELAAGSITASKLSVGDTSNMAVNPSFVDGESGGWTLPAGFSSVLGPSAHDAINMYGRIYTATAAKSYYNGEFFPVQPGEIYYVSMWVYRSSANATFSIGMAMAFAGGGSETQETAFTAPSNLTNNTWTFYEGYVTVPAGKYVARLWGRVASNASPAGYWNFSNLVARRATDTKLLVNGTVELTNADKTNAAISVKNSGGTEVLRLGNITGKTGVPSGTQFGLWGALGTGVFIQGAPRVIAAGTFTVSQSTSTVTNGSRKTFQGNYSLGSRTVPSGKKWILIPYLMGTGDLQSLLLRQERQDVTFNSASGFDMIAAAGSYSPLAIYYYMRYYNDTGASITLTTYSVKCSYIVLEIDA